MVRNVAIICAAALAAVAFAAIPGSAIVTSLAAGAGAVVLLRQHNQRITLLRRAERSALAGKDRRQAVTG